MIGAHQSVAGGVSQAVARARADGARSFQIFTKSARAWQSPPLLHEEARRFRSGRADAALPAVAHGSYLVNLATDDAALRARSLRCVREELTRCEALGVSDLIIHPGTHPDVKHGLRRIAQALDRLHRSSPDLDARVCLEVTAGQGGCLGWRLEHLEEILQQLDAPERVGVCLDTCHLFAAGYDLRRPRAYEAMVRECETRFGLSRIRCIHLNDSKKDLGSRVDRHEEIGRGAIGLAAFQQLVNDPRFEDTIAVLETPAPERYAQAIALLEGLRGVPLPRAHREPDARA